MKIYHIAGPVIMFLLWIYILIEGLKGLRKIKNASGRSYFFLFNVFNYRQIVRDKNSNDDLKKVYDDQRKRSRRLFLVWAISCFAYVIIAAIIQALTKGK